jgi:hypothetical protein
VKVFFSFDRDADGERAAMLRGLWDGPDRTSSGFCDDWSWGAVQSRGPSGVEEWVRGEMEAADVVLVLIGAETAYRSPVRLAIEHAVAEGIGVVGVRVHRLGNEGATMAFPGPDPLFAMRDRFTTHDWLPGFSDRFLPSWIELAAERARSATP